MVKLYLRTHYDDAILKMSEKPKHEVDMGETEIAKEIDLCRSVFAFFGQNPELFKQYKEFMIQRFGKSFTIVDDSFWN